MKPKLLYLGFHLPDELHKLRPHHSPAGQNFESALLAELRNYFDVRTVSLVASSFPKLYAVPAETFLLHERKPQLWHYICGVKEVESHYRQLKAQNWQPDHILTYNFSPIYNTFLRRHHHHLPQIHCLLADSPLLHQKVPWGKAWRYRWKPFVFRDEQMLPLVKRVICLSYHTHTILRETGYESLWMPGACEPRRALPCLINERTGPLTFGYFGNLGPYTGIDDLVLSHQRSSLTNKLLIAGYGKRADYFRKLCQTDSRLRFVGTFDGTEETLRFGQACDILVNPRPASHGNENNFPSKIFSYALCGAAILTTRSGGVNLLLGDSAFYINEKDIKVSLSHEMEKISQLSRADLAQRTQHYRETLFRDYTWAEQGRRLGEFLSVQS